MHRAIGILFCFFSTFEMMKLRRTMSVRAIDLNPGRERRNGQKEEEDKTQKKKKMATKYQINYTYGSEGIEKR